MSEPLHVELTRLRTEVAILRTTENADNERLRAALQLAADHLASEGYTIEADMARRALEPKP